MIFIREIGRKLWIFNYPIQPERSKDSFGYSAPYEWTHPNHVTNQSSGLVGGPSAP